MLNTQISHPAGTLSAYEKTYGSVVTTSIFPLPLRGNKTKSDTHRK